MKLRSILVWILWFSALASLVIAHLTGWISVPAWIVVVFALVLLVFGLVWCAVSWKNVTLRRQTEK
jgi:uncharacterized membrane protein